MKFKLLAFLAFSSLGLFLVSCSLAEDITPPPGYQYISPTPVTATPTTEEALVPTSAGTVPPATETAQATSVGTESASSAASIPVSGKVTCGPGVSLGEALTAHLYLYNSNSSTVDQTLTTQVSSDGSYSFNAVPASTSFTYFSMVDYQGVTYASEPTSYDGKSDRLEIPVKIFEATSDTSTLGLMQVHMTFDYSQAGTVSAQLTYVITNNGDKTVVVQSDGTSIPFIKVPAGATGVQFGLAQGGSPLTTAVNGFALIPGSDKLYGIIASFSFPFSNRLQVNQPFVLPVNSETILVPPGVKVSSAQLADAGVQTFQSQNYHLYQGGSLAPGSSLSFTLSGKPGAGLDTRTIVLIAVGVIGLLLTALGLFLYVRDRRAALQSAAAGAGQSEIRLSDDKDSIMDAIIALDEQFKEGKISREAYEKRRNELKLHLRELL